ncbi:MAG: amidoligase family protein [Verrucomicrobiia bacterium]
MKPQDTKAAEIRFGVEIETFIPMNAGIAVGQYHHGLPVTQGRSARSHRMIEATAFTNGDGVGYWVAERDGSIRPDDATTHMPCEFSSPVLKGEHGLECLRAFVQFLNRIGARVNQSCGLHVTVSIDSVTGSAETNAISDFMVKLGYVAAQNTWAIFAQTTPHRVSDQQVSSYCHRLPANAETLLKTAKTTTDAIQKQTLTAQCGRGMVNCLKAFTHRAVEFRAWAGTTDEALVLHHVATALGLMRRAHETQAFGKFSKSAKKNKAATAPEALRRMWRVLGWVDAAPGRETALGLFGTMHSQFPAMKDAAMKRAEDFERALPAANL